MLCCACDETTGETCVGLLMPALAFADAAGAQTSAPPRPQPADAGYVEGVAQAAFSDVTSQSYGVEAGFSVRPHLQIYADIGSTRDVAPSSFSAAAQTIAGGLPRSSRTSATWRRNR